MATGTAGNQARSQHVQVVNTWRKQINWNDASNGTNVARLVLPQGSFILQAFVEVVTTFDGGALLTLGANANGNDIIAAGDVDETIAGVYQATRGLGRSLASAADTTIYSRLTSAGGTQGQAELVLCYEANTG